MSTTQSNLTETATLNPTETKSNQKNNLNWPKQLYYYAILAGCVLFLAIGSFTFLRANLVRFVLPESDYGYYPSYPESDARCMYKDMYAYKVPAATQPNEPAAPVLNTPEEKKACEQKLEVEKQKEINRRYQQDMLNSILMLVVSSCVLVAHIYTFKRIRNSDV